MMLARPAWQPACSSNSLRHRQLPEGYGFSLLTARIHRARSPEHAMLGAYKTLASELLPSLRGRCHLHNLTFSKSNTTLVMVSWITSQYQASS